MGFLDDYFNPQQFEGQGPGLLAMLTKMAQAQPGPSQGFPPQGPGGNGMMMPVPNMSAIAGARGDVGPYFPSQGAPPPPPPPPPPSPQGPSVFQQIMSGIGQGIGNNSNALLAGGGAMISGGLGHGLSAMAAASPLDIAARRERQGNQAVEATYQALLRHQLTRGIPLAEAQATALAAAQNPEILKNVLGPQFQKAEATGIMDQKTPLAFDPRTGKYFDAAGKPYGGAPTSSDVGQPLETGQPYLDKYVPREFHSSIKAIAQGEMPATGLGTLKKLAPYVENYQPGFDVTKYPAMLQTRKSFAPGGKDYAEVEALNTVGGHMGRLMDAAIKLDPSDWKFVNSLKNLYSDKITDNPALVRFRNDLVTTQNELAKAYHGGHVTDASFAAFNKAFSENMSLPGMKAAIGEMAGLLGSKINAKEQGYKLAMNDAPLPSRFTAIREEAGHSFQRINDWANGIPPASAASGARAAPQPVQAGRYVWTPDGGMVPMR